MKMKQPQLTALKSVRLTNHLTSKRVQETLQVTACTNAKDKFGHLVGFWIK